MVFNVDTTPEKYFGQLIEVFKILPPFNKLRKRQRQVYAEILYINHKLSGEKPELISRLLFDYKTKDEISIKLGITKANLYNIYKELRQLEFLLKDEINPKYKYKYMQVPEINFKFRTKDSNVQ